MFRGILILAATLMHVYVFWRAASVPALKRRIPRNVLFGAGAFLWGVLVIARVRGHGGDGTAAAALDLIGMNWLAVLFLATVCLLVLDLATGFGLLLPRSAPTLRGVALAAAGAELMLSGHTHGGQIWPFGYLVRLVYPYVDGVYQRKGMTIVVSRGAGTWGACMRLWRPAQILRIRLRA